MWWYKNGNRDLERTEKVKEELSVRDWEAEVLGRWEVYEKAWSELLRTRVWFTDIPWPVRNPSVVTLANLTPGSIQSFILDPLKVRGNTTSTRERIRTSLLRWHPDKLTGLVSRVAEEDVDDVTEGIGIVIRCLREISGKS
ncbi:hypothetical protein K435DRAFT_668766 [Dendrothele bispora CBS 962.96]|uniref:Uncharacterized protein n=1 Tax=Dendrothele bispora (strain CBS 962.96) TaxID=1314807 RepID=A0A4V4HFB3_DENBC|nr:hypothetical protein K435DRAFT_668766 [Dendrothele bispora CBS 962.96]